MNSKMIAIISVIALVFVGFAALTADDTDGSTLDRVTVAVGESDNKTQVAVNEGNYTHYDYTLTWKMEIGQSTETIGTITNSETNANSLGTWYVISNDGNVSISGDVPSSENKTRCLYSIEMQRDQMNTGVYTLSFEGINATDAISYVLTASITIEIDGVEKIITDFATYSGSVSVFVAQSGGAFEATLDDTGAQVGKFYDKQIGVPQGMVISDYDWYAVDLPFGLTMSQDGHVSGIPTVEITKTTDYDFRVFATDVDGNVLYSDIEDFTIEPKAASTPASYTYSVNGKHAGSYIFEAGIEKIELVVTTNGDSPTVIDNADVKTVNASASSDDGYQTTTTIPCIGGKYALPSTGSGAYQVQITYEGVTTTFTVYIIGEAGEISANIFIQGA